ncbi:MAG: tetratricopeptide repeat protein [Planctomycetes bacterium]|nr:tetratricopeptide repeat protein [Planctomycetota bacterium]
MHISVSSVSPTDVTGGMLPGEASLPPVDQEAALYVSRLQAGDRSPDVLEWLSHLRKEQLTALIDKSPRRRDNHAANDTLVEAFLKHPDVSLDCLIGLSDRCILLIADSLARHGDQQCVKLYEVLLSRRKGKANAAVPELTGLGEYYGKAGDHGKAADTYMRAGDYSTHRPFLANRTLDAAREYFRSGDEKKANELYERVPSFGYGWATGVALCDRASLLMQQGRYDQAREILATPINGDLADQVAVTLYSYLGDLHFVTRKFEDANKWYQKAVKQFHGLPGVVPNEGTESTARHARLASADIEEWAVNPIRAYPKSVRLTLKGREDSSYGEILIRTPTPLPIPLNIRADPSLVNVRLATGSIQRGLFTERVLFFQFIRTPGMGEALRAVISISSPQFTGYRLDIPCEIHRSRDVTVSRPRMFFGLVKHGTALRQSVTISAQEEFNVSKTIVDSPHLVVAHASSEDKRMAQVTVVIPPSSVTPDTLLEGSVAIVLDFSGAEEVINMPYSGYVE